MRQDLIVKGEVIAGNDVDASILLDLPVSKTKSLGFDKQVGLRDLATPVCIQLSVIPGWTVDLNALPGNHLQASVAFFRSRLTPMRGKPRMADLTILGSVV
jgi:hypothetical protein